MNDCNICKNQGMFEYRLKDAEKDIQIVDKRLTVAKTEIFNRFDKVNNYLIATLTTALISVVLLIGDIAINYWR